jgi:hypothetical protein
MLPDIAVKSEAVAFLLAGKSDVAQLRGNGAPVVGKFRCPLINQLNCTGARWPVYRDSDLEEAPC